MHEEEREKERGKDSWRQMQCAHGEHNEHTHTQSETADIIDMDYAVHLLYHYANANLLISIFVVTLIY